MNSHTITLLILGCLAGARALTAAVPGALESFPAAANADSWAVYDYADDTVYYPEWQNETDPYIYLLHFEDEPLWFLTDAVGSPAWLGDYQVEEIQSIKVDVFIDSLEEFDELDCTVFTNGPAGARDYFSAPLWASDFSSNGWWELTFDLATTWYYFDDGWVPVEMEPEHFREVEEIGFRFFPRIGTSTEIVAAIDQVRLEPLVQAPAVEISTTANDFHLEFTPLKANTCFIEKLSDDPTPAWIPVPGQSGISGPEKYTYSTPLNAGRGIFRLGAEAEYTQIAVDTLSTLSPIR